MLKKWKFHHDLEFLLMVLMVIHWRQWWMVMDLMAPMVHPIAIGTNDEQFTRQVNGLHTRHSLVHALYTTLLQASEVCEVDISTIRKVTTVGNSQGTAFIVTLKDHDTAKQLHNNGRGDIKFYQSDKIEFFPVKAKDRWVTCWEDVLFELKWQGHFVLDQWCSTEFKIFTM